MFSGFRVLKLGSERVLRFSECRVAQKTKYLLIGDRVGCVDRIDGASKEHVTFANSLWRSGFPDHAGGITLLGGSWDLVSRLQLGL